MISFPKNIKKNRELGCHARGSADLFTQQEAHGISVSVQLLEGNDKNFAEFRALPKSKNALIMYYYSFFIYPYLSIYLFFNYLV